MMMKCPNCSAEVEYIEGDSELCSECGSELKSSSCSGNKTAAPTDGMDFLETLKQISSSVFSGNGAPESYGDLSSRSREIAENIEKVDFTPQVSGDCPHLKVEYNNNLFFLSGSESVIKLKLTPLDNSLKELLIFMETGRGQSNSRRQVQVNEVLHRDRAFVLQIPFNPGEISGRMVLNFYIGCNVDGAFNYYQFSVGHKVYDSHDSGSSICSQITINQEFTASGAADINYRGTIGDEIRKLADKHVSVNEMIDRLNDLPPEYKVKNLVKTNWRPEDVLIKGNLYPAEKLVIEYNGTKIFLLNKKSVKFGRDPETVDLLVRCGSGKLGPRDYPNSTVSRKHAEILWCEDTVKFFDYSSYGTYINGRKPDDAGIPIESGAMVEFGDIHWQMTIQKCYARLPHNICKTCSACNVKSVTFKRTDGEPECYLLVWQCCELGRVVNDLMDWTVFTRNNCFFIRTPSQDFYHLRPGQKVEYNGKVIEVKYFEQY